MTQARWKKFTDWPLTFAALAFLIAYAWEVIADLSGRRAIYCDAVIWITWGTFVVDYIVNFILAKPRWTWFRRHLLDLIIVTLPALRPLRLLRLVTVLNVLQQHSTGTKFRGRVISYAALSAGLLVFVAALAKLDAERDIPGASIATFGNALWWSFTTITTVGDGNLSPVTITGRVIAAGLMIGGISLLGVITATFASWIVERVAHKDEAEQVATRGQIAELAERLTEFESKIARSSEKSTEG